LERLSFSFPSHSHSHSHLFMSHISPPWGTGRSSLTAHVAASELTKWLQTTSKM
jgi:hypothetical protein